MKVMFFLWVCKYYKDMIIFSFGYYKFLEFGIVFGVLKCLMYIY